MDQEALPAEVTLGLFVLALLACVLCAWVMVLRRLRRRQPLLPDAPPRRVPWGLGSVLGVVLLYLSCSQVLTAAYHATSRSGGQASPVSRASRELSQARDQLFLMGVLNGAMLIAIPLSLRAWSGATLKDLGLSSAGCLPNLRRGVVACLLIAPVSQLLMAALSKIWPPHPHPLQEMLEQDKSGSIIVLAFVSGVILAPIAEELLFRGIVLPWLGRLFISEPRPPLPDLLESEGFPEAEPLQPAKLEITSYNRAWPNIITSAIFAAMHLPQWPAPLPLFALSLVLGWITLRTGSLWAAISLHACFNGLSTLLLILAIGVGD